MFEIETEEYFVANEEEERPRQELDFENLCWNNGESDEYEE